ncbi:MAG TPA: TorF family putative porin, partial [Pseudomonadales bacterium]
MKRLIMAALISGSAYSGYVAADEISANVGLSTEYRFRGISQTDRDPAISGGFDYGHESGFYVGTWASNVSFTDGGTEIDVYAGWAGDISEEVSIDVGVLYYGYPEDNDADYVEVYGSVGFFGATVGLHYSPEYTYDTGDYFYLYGDYSL